jgi:hypothetical protein
MTWWARAHLVIPDVAPSAPHTTRTRIDSVPPATARARNLHGRLTHRAAFPLHEHSVRTHSRERGVTPGARAHGVLRPAPGPGCPATDASGAWWWVLSTSARCAPARLACPLHDTVGPGPPCHPPSHAVCLAWRTHSRCLPTVLHSSRTQLTYAPDAPCCVPLALPPAAHVVARGWGDTRDPGPSCPVIGASWPVAPVVGYMPKSRRSPNCGGRPASTISRAVAAASYSVRRNSTRTGSPSSTSSTR